MSLLKMDSVIVSVAAISTTVGLLRFCLYLVFLFFFFFSSRRRHTRYWRDWSSDVCSSDLELALQEIIGPGLDHIAPRRRGLLHAEAEVAQTRLDQDRLGHAEGGLDHEQRAAVEPQDVLENDRVRRQPERMRRLDEALLPKKRDLARDQVGDHRHAGDADHDHDVIDVGFEGGDHEQDQHQAWERVEQVVEVSDDRIEPAAAVARQDAENAAADDGNRDGKQSW